MAMSDLPALAAAAPCPRQAHAPNIAPPRTGPIDAVHCAHILATIRRLSRLHGRPPTYREVLAAAGLNSHRRLSAGLDALVAAGRLRRLPGSRNLIVVADYQPIPDAER
jgi:hypothetical protein